MADAIPVLTEPKTPKTPKEPKGKPAKAVPPEESPGYVRTELPGGTVREDF